MGQRDIEQESDHDEPPIKQLPVRRRHTFLRGRYRWNDLRCQPPYNETPIYFVEDLLWIARQRGWRVLASSPEGGRFARFGRALKSRIRREPTYGDPPDLRGAVLVNLDLSEFDLTGANLEGATFTDGCKLDGAKLVNANLRGTKLGRVDLSHAILLDPKGTRTGELSAQLPIPPAAPPTGAPVQVYTRNELLWAIIRGCDRQWIDLSNCDVYERDLDGLGFSHANFASAKAWALIGPLMQNRTAGKEPFADIIVHSWKDLCWLKLASAAGILPIMLSPQELSNLSGANLSGCDFRGADLYRADLRNVKLEQVVLDASDLSFANLSETKMNEASARGANLVCANLAGARLYGAHLDGANLLEAHLRNARLDSASLCGASLSIADLRGATFRNANLKCTDLRGARVNAATSFIDSTINKGTQWGDMVFHSTPLLEINWRNAKTLGDESNLYIYDYVKRSTLRYGHYRDVMRAYRQIYAKLYEQGFYGPARRYRLREKWLVRQQLWENRQWYDWFISWLAFFLIGYGEQPGKLLRPYFAVIALWTVFYYGLAHRTLDLLPPYKPDPITWIQSAVLSASTFRGEPNFPSILLQQHYIGTLLPVFGAVETAIGTIILLAMTLLWARRLFGNETPVVEVGEHRWRRQIARVFRRTRESSVAPPTPTNPTQDTS